MNGLTLVLLLWTQFIFFCNASYEIGGDKGCPRGAFRFDDHCFSLNNMKVNYEKGAKYCEENGGTLLKWKDENSDNIAQKLRIHNLINDFWIGLENRKDDNWIFADGNELLHGGFTAWGKTNPTKSKTEHCVKLNSRKRYTWNSVNCTDKLFYICEFNGCNGKNGGKCHYGSHYYQLNYDAVNYETAKRSCKSKGGNLASIKTKALFIFIKILIIHDTTWKSMGELQVSETISVFKSLFHIAPLWVGIRFVNDQRVFSDGTNATYYSHNLLHEPNHSFKNNECLEVRTEQWQNANCNKHQQFICQYKYRPSTMKSSTFYLNDKLKYRIPDNN